MRQRKEEKVSKPYRDPRTLVPMNELTTWADLYRRCNLTDLAPTLRQRLAWDIIPDKDVVRWTKSLGLSPASPDVSSTEMAAATHRRLKLNSLANVLGMLGTVSGELIVAARMEEAREKGVASPVGAVKTGETEDVITAVIAGSIAVVAELLDLGILTYGKALRP